MAMKISFALLFAFLFILNAASADIILSKQQSIVNLGETLPLEVSIFSNIDKTAFLTLSLFCRNETLEFYKSPVTIKSGEQKKIESALPLTNSFLSGLKGECHILASYGLDSLSGSQFKISDSIGVSFQLSRAQINAGEFFEIKGSAVREDGKLANGNANIRISSVLSIIIPVTNGTFTTNLSFPQNTRSGNYNIEAEVFEEDAEIKTNTGKSYVQIKILQAPKSIEIALAEQSITPGGKLKIKPFLFDQAHEPMDGKLKVLVFDNFGSEISNYTADSGREFLIQTYTNDSAGYWKITALIENVSGGRDFYIEEFADIELQQDNDILSVTNIGNVKYEKQFEFNIGDERVVKNLSLSPGETAKFKLSAPTGEYDLFFRDKNTTFSNVALTGKTVSVKNLGEGGGWQKYTTWFVIALFFGVGLFFIARRASKNSFKAEYPVYSGFKRETPREFQAKPVQVQMKNDIRYKVIQPDNGTPITETEYSLVIKGEKQDAGIVAIKHSGFFDEITNIAKQYKGVTYISGAHTLLLFMPSLTKTMKNEILAIKAANDISSLLGKKNQNYGVGVHYGTLVTNVQAGKLQFTSLENATLTAKKICDLSGGELLLSKEVAQKAGSEIRTQRLNKDNMTLYSLSKFIDTQNNEKFISDFMRRNF